MKIHLQMKYYDQLSNRLSLTDFAAYDYRSRSLELFNANKTKPIVEMIENDDFPLSDRLYELCCSRQMWFSTVKIR